MQCTTATGASKIGGWSFGSCVTSPWKFERGGGIATVRGAAAPHKFLSSNNIRPEPVLLLRKRLVLELKKKQEKVCVSHAKIPPPVALFFLHPKSLNSSFLTKVYNLVIHDPTLSYKISVEFPLTCQHVEYFDTRIASN